MSSIFKAIRDNDTQLFSYFIQLSANERPSSTVSKQDRQWIHHQLKISGQKLFDLNKRSSRGKTALHYAATWNRLEMASQLISLPHVDVNLRDRENGWTALHRCLYFGNLEIARMLLKRQDIDLHVKDWEGLEAFELYNLTISNTLPTERFLKKDGVHARKGGTDLYTWGQNANYVLGHLDTENKTKPERVRLQLESQKSPFIMQRPNYLIETVAMSKYHMGILTTESNNNLLVCGFGSGGRLGTGKESDTQFAPIPVQWPERITSVALGRDHTIAVTDKGSVISFGNNTYGQLGYETDNHKSKKEPMQLVPRKIQAQSLKKQPIIGAAASRVHSVVYTATDIFTFGFNQGQLGYHQPDNEKCQVVPRKVSMSTEIIQVVANDNCTAILSAPFQVILLCNYTQQKLFFPVDRFPSNITVHRSEPTSIVKLVASGTEHLGAVSNTGDVFLWTCRPFHPRNSIDLTGGNRNSKLTQSTAVSAPKRIWPPLNKPYFGAVDAGIGQRGEVIVCTLSGHVYKGMHLDKFNQIPHLQRCVRVCANSSGAYAAIRSEHLLPPIENIADSTLQHDLSTSLPHINAGKELHMQLSTFIQALTMECEQQAQKCKLGPEVDQDYVSKQQQIIRQKYSQRIASALDHAWRRSDELGMTDRLLDVVFCVGVRSIYCHSAVLRCRTDIFNQLAKCADRCSAPSTMNGIAIRLEKRPDSGRIAIHLDHCQVAAVLLLLDYIYTDQYEHPMNAFFQIPDLCFADVDSFTDKRSIHTAARQIQRDLVALATVFGLPHLLSSAQQPFSHTPVPSLTDDLKLMLDKAKGTDIFIQIAENEPPSECHQIILRQRCPYFGNLLKPGSVWTSEKKRVQVNLDHISKEVMDTIIRFIYTDQDKSTLFSYIQQDQEESMIQFLLAFLCEADFLLLGRLKSITEQVLVPFIKLRSATTIFEYADVCLADSLKRSCLEFISVNLPVFLDSNMFDSIADSLVRDLEAYVRQSQMNKMPFAPRRQGNHADLDIQQQQQEEEQEDIEFSSSLYALSRGDGSAVTYDEVLYTLYPAKPSLARQKSEQSTSVADEPHSKHLSTVSTTNARIKRGTKVQLNDLESELSLIAAATTPQRRQSLAGWGTMAATTMLESAVKPSLREIIEIENQTGTALIKNQKSAIPKKTSQKERRRLAQQQEHSAGASAASASAGESCSSSAKPVWGKTPITKVKPMTKTMCESETCSSKEPLSAPSSNIAADMKGKKIYVSESLLEHVDQYNNTPTVREIRPLYNPRDSLGPSFRLTPIHRHTSSVSQNDKAPSKRSFQSILKQQELEDHWRKDNRPKKSVALIQKEEQALTGIGQYQVQTLNVLSGEWFEIERL
ncbi:hypothetical protein BD408DRAFT_369912 [Parasitella parasitica]|nr:hypothetical protein BD408DRAFT_369912 [Parasitella parasitica]